MRWPPHSLLLGAATVLLVVADTLALLTAHQAAALHGCSSTTRINVVAPVLLAGGGFLVVMSLVTKLATAGVGRGAPRPRWGVFITVLVVVILAFAVSALAMYTASSFKLCV